MSTTGLDVFDRTLQTTHIWLDQIMEELGPDRRVAWHVLGATLRVLRDRLSVNLAAHLGAQLPILIRGIYYDQWSPAEKRVKPHSADEFLETVARALGDIRPVNVEQAVRVVFATMADHLEHGQVRKVRQALPKSIQALWPEAQPKGTPAAMPDKAPIPPDFPK